MQEALNEWFIELRQYMTTAGYPDIFDDPTHIYNADESGFPLSPKLRQSPLQHQERKACVLSWFIIIQAASNGPSLYECSWALHKAVDCVPGGSTEG